MHILIIEDTINISEHLSLAFKEVFLDVTIDIAETIAEAERLLESSSYDVISLDVMLPDGNGLDLAKSMRQRPHLKETILLMITEVSDYQVGFLAYDQARCYKYMVKPFNEQELLHTLFELKNLFSKRNNESYFQYSTRQMSVRIKNQYIVYAEINLKSITVHTTISQINLGRITIKELLIRLGDDFIQIHRGFIVNKNHLTNLIKSVHGWSVLLNHEHLKLPVGANFKEFVLEVFEGKKDVKIN